MVKTKVKVNINSAIINSVVWAFYHWWAYSQDPLELLRILRWTKAVRLAMAGNVNGLSRRDRLEIALTSPFVVACLLIAVTVIVCILVYFWITSMVAE